MTNSIRNYTAYPRRGNQYAAQRRVTGQQQGRPRFALNRSLLPDPLVYYTHWQQMTLTGAGEWKSARCIFHDDTRPSLSINIRSGGYYCFVCGAKGGDVIAFHMAHAGLPFIDACKALGAWGATA